MKIHKINLFKEMYGNNTLGLNHIFAHVIMPEKVISNEHFEAHISEIQLMVAPEANSLLRGILETIIGDYRVICKGKATLHKDDIRDTLVGKDVAEHKALAKVFDCEVKILEQLYNLVGSPTIGNTIKGYIRKAQKKRNRQLNCIMKMVK